MCEYCHSYPHFSGCPNAPDPEVAMQCDNCGGDIYVGDYYFEIAGKVYCEDCMYDAAYALAVESAEKHHVPDENSKHVEVGTCACCEDPVYDDEEYFVYDGKFYHEECYADCAADIFDDKIDRCEAEEYEPDWDMMPGGHDDY